MARQILVVEDEPLIRMDAVAMLKSAGLEVVEFDRGEEALHYARTNHDDVAAVFTDITLSGAMDGIDLARSLARAAPGIALLVTSGRYHTRPGGLPASAQFMKKPWLPLEVISSLQTAVGH